MRRTFNEIAGTLKKAAVGSGFPPGLAEDAGRAAAWLARNGADGVGAVLAGIERGFSGVSADRSQDAGVDFDDAHVAVVGPCALDLVLAGIAGGGVRLKNADAPVMMIGLAGCVADDHETAFRLEFSNGATADVGQGGFSLSGEFPVPGCDVTVTPAAHAAGGRAEVARGADVDPAIWKRADALAVKTYVPATEASRLQGAGAGLTDND
jgi:hypothetical protein